jgi:chemotaxis protein MotB
MGDKLHHDDPGQISPSGSFGEIAVDNGAPEIPESSAVLVEPDVTISGGDRGKIFAGFGAPGDLLSEDSANFSPDRRAHGDEQPFDSIGHVTKTTHWSIAWSDLMMTMFILFLVMYVYKDASKVFLSSEGIGGDLGTVVGAGAPIATGGGLVGSAEAPVEEALSRIYDLSRQAITDEDFGYFASVELVPDNTVRIILTGDVLFDSGSDMIKPGAVRSLQRVAELIKQTPFVINVVGHTDDRPIQTERFPSNWELSLARASRVARFMIDEMGLPPSRFFVSGHASFQPVKTNDTEQNRASNRRVEIIITREMPRGI